MNKIKNRTISKKNFLFWSLLVFFLIFFVIMRVFVFNVVKVEGISMEPTYYSNDILVINKLQTPSLNDVVVVKSPSNENNYIIKRITAVEGMTVFYNGKEITLKEDEYFLMGDNYYKSNDSRAFGPITHDKIIGVVDFKIR